MLENITINELLKQDNVSIIDIRSNEQYNNNHIPSAYNIPSNNLLDNPSKYLDKNKKYYLYCQKGIRSKKTCQMLNIQGYKTVNILGGYESYILNN